jgi:glycerol 2-dehydrogenase (NADP+)
LKALGLDFVDLCSTHWPSSTDPDDLPKHLSDFRRPGKHRHWRRAGSQIDECRAEMQKLPATGKVKNIGISNFGTRNMEILLNGPSCKTVPIVNEIELHLKNPSPRLVAYLKEEGIHRTVYPCLGSTGSPLYKNKTLLDIAEKKGKTVQLILLVWGLPKDWSVIPKSATKECIEKKFAVECIRLTSMRWRRLIPCQRGSMSVVMAGFR